MTAAETIRENDPGATIGIISDEPHQLYSRVLLPAYLKKKVRREQLFLRKVDDFTQKRIDLRLDEKVLFVDPQKREVGLHNNAIVGYEKLLVASGGRVKPWGQEVDQEFIYRLQTLDDADRFLSALDTIKRPLVVGGSFISLEFLDIFVLNSITSILLFRGKHFFSKILDAQGGEILRTNFERHGIAIYQEDSIAQIARRDGALEVDTKALRRITCDSIAVGIGIDRSLEFLSGSGIELGESGIKTDEFLKTNKDGVFAAGDAAEFYDVIRGKHRSVGNWTNAFLQGKIAGLNMVGKKEPFQNVSAYSITNLGFQITVLGECDSELDNIVRVDETKNQYERLFFQEGVLVGAAMINRFQDKPHLSRLIEQRANFDKYRDKMKGFEFDIREILALD